MVIASPRKRTLATLGLLVALAPIGLAAASCHEAARALGRTPEAAQAHADALLSTMAARFGPILREPAFDQVRPKLARSAFVPSRLFQDASAWTALDGPLRRLELAGRDDGGRYRMAVRADAPEPGRAADYRGVIGLRSLGGGDFEWSVRDELAIGAVAPADLARAHSALLRAADVSAPEDARDRLRAMLPRTSAALGRLFSLEVLRLAPSPQGGTELKLVTSLEPAGIEKEFPHYARFLRNYVSPARFQIAADDPSGVRFWEAGGRANRFTLRLRVQQGDVVTLEGPAHRVPDTLRLRLDFSAKMGLFRVGVRGLASDLVLTRAPSHKALAARFHEEPRWELPPLVKPILRGPLRRPFEAEGSELAFAVRASGAGPTLLTREYRLAVKESWIVRWLGGLAGGAVNEFRRGAEEEADRFSGQVLKALRADVLTLLDASERPLAAGRH